MKLFLFWLTFIFTGALSISANAADRQVDLSTPRGSLIKLDVYNPGMPTALLLGPGQGCNPRLDMYEAIANEAKINQFTVVRLYWAYCLASPQDGQPSEDLSTEKEDFQTALSYVRKTLNLDDSHIFIGGKSLGTFVSQEIFLNQKSLPALLMLTPVCTDSQSDSKNRKNVFEENYTGLALESRRVLLAQGNSDPLCDTSHFQDFVKGKGNNFVPLVVKGNHSFGIQDPDGQFNADLGAKNLKVISNWIFTWLK